MDDEDAEKLVKELQNTDIADWWIIYDAPVNEGLKIIDINGQKYMAVNYFSMETETSEWEILKQ